MKIYQLRQDQILPISIDAAWDFFSTPKNLERITPKDMSFTIISELRDEKAFTGQVINYKIELFKWMCVRWTKEISQCVDKKYFVDEQQIGPYAFCLAS
tara:strand:+ start:619 stop:915 length:297 start_codon:yes stop_codon:yes gene_type:complete